MPDSGSFLNLGEDQRTAEKKKGNRLEKELFGNEDEEEEESPVRSLESPISMIQVSTTPLRVYLVVVDSSF